MENMSEHLMKDTHDLVIMLMKLKLFSVGNHTFPLLILHSDLVL